ncbi:hypothetical protein V1478_017981 [Vespula squamosa]|uniref:Maturase K n=1 Tax=Vespula squamosa TaxID=30214 RepID=A0ABD1ZVR7_VESSQ
MVIFRSFVDNNEHVIQPISNEYIRIRNTRYTSTYLPFEILLIESSGLSSMNGAGTHHVSLSERNFRVWNDGLWEKVLPRWPNYDLERNKNILRRNLHVVYKIVNFSQRNRKSLRLLASILMAILYKLAQGLPERNSITAVECLDERSKRNAHPETGLLKLLWEKPPRWLVAPFGCSLCNRNRIFHLSLMIHLESPRVYRETSVTSDPFVRIQ